MKTPGAKMNELLKSLEPVNSGAGRSGDFHSRNRRKMLGFLENWLTNLARAYLGMSEAEEKMNAIVLVAGDDNQRHLRAVSVYLTCAQFLDSGGVEKEKGGEVKGNIDKVVDGYLWFVREFRFEETGGTFLELWQKFAYRGAGDVAVISPSPVVGFRADAFRSDIVIKETPAGVRDLMNAELRFPVWFIVAGIVVVAVLLFH